MNRIVGFLLAWGLVWTAQAQESTYSNNLKMREDRRVGVGTQVGGSAGMMGLHVELNIEDQDGVLAGFGLGEGFSTFSLAWKHNFEGEFFTPYTTMGVSRWYNSAGTSPARSYLLDSLLTAEEKSSGRFGVDFLVGSLGAQYNQLDGELAGASFFAQADLFLAPFRGQVMPSASVGVTYFF
ncbi:MAG: hypothetical protein KF802_09895 [Bdellovibrionaceae bacterium]|nr:hypothetical protein [Pseudobdellovibrionaceae bacterium]